MNFKPGDIAKAVHCKSGPCDLLVEIRSHLYAGLGYYIYAFGHPSGFSAVNGAHGKDEWWAWKQWLRPLPPFDEDLNFKRQVGEDIRRTLDSEIDT